MNDFVVRSMGPAGPVYFKKDKKKWGPQLPGTWCWVDDRSKATRLSVQQARAVRRTLERWASGLAGYHEIRKLGGMEVVAA